MIFPFVKINDAVILDRSNWVVQGGAGWEWEQEIYRAVEDFIVEAQAPGIRMERGKWVPGFSDWVFGRGQGCLRISNSLDGDLETIVICVAVSSFGESLVVNWWSMVKLGFWRWLLERAGYWLEGKPVPTPLAVELDVRQRETLLRPFTSVAFTATQTAVQQVMEALGHDLSDLHSKGGFLT